MTFAVRKKNILITGAPGVGKTTLIKKISYELQHLHPAGFLTEEIRVEGVRKGFSLVSLDGLRATLSHTDIVSHERVGKYGVDIAVFEEFLDRIAFFSPDIGVIIIDEIGKMECLSSKFNKLLRTMLEWDRPVIAAISREGEGIIKEIRNRADANLLVMTYKNRNSLLPEILRLVHA